MDAVTAYHQVSHLLAWLADKRQIIEKLLCCQGNFDNYIGNTAIQTRTNSRKVYIFNINYNLAKYHPCS